MNKIESLKNMLVTLKTTEGKTSVEAEKYANEYIISLFNRLYLDNKDIKKYVDTRTKLLNEKYPQLKEKTFLIPCIND